MVVLARFRAAVVVRLLGWEDSGVEGSGESPDPAAVMALVLSSRTCAVENAAASLRFAAEKGNAVVRRRRRS
ncbi:hypothetical protein GCM10027174_39210 [Salinifilum aidingensis]